MSGQSNEAAESPIWAWHRALSLSILYIAVSSALIIFNKFLMHEERFPYPAILTTFHMAGSWLLCGLLFLVMPAMFPAMERTQGRKTELLKWFTPIGFFFAVALYCSNRAYLYCSVAFLQFMKEANLVIVFVLSCLFGLQFMSRQRLVVIAWIIGGSSLAVHGELHFSLTGFIIQAISQVSESMKNVMGEYVLTGGGLKLDPLTYIMFIAPACLTVLLVADIFTWSPDIPGRIVEWWPYLLPNALVAFSLNVSIAMLIKECSAVAFVLAGLAKDILIVSVSAMVFGDYISAQQIVGFAATLFGIFFWAYMKASPQSPVVRLLDRMVCDHKRSLDVSENTPFAGTGPVSGRV